MTNIYKGKGCSKDYAHSLEFLNEVFFSEEEPENRRDFVSLLPKLYKEKYSHCENNFIVSENGEWKGAVGLFYDDLYICGEKIKCAGIGNVAVSKDCRGKGYMKDCMKMSMQDAIEMNADFSVLGGQRQRYGYFSFEPAGSLYSFVFTNRNKEHVYGIDYKSSLTPVKVLEEDADAIAFVEKMYNQNPSRFERKHDNIFDILSSWLENVFVFKKGNAFVGYCIINDENKYVHEINAVDIDTFKDMLPAILALSDLDGVHFQLPLYQGSYIDYLSRVCERYSLEHCSMMTVLNWKRFIPAILKLKASYTPLCDGQASFLIHGYKQDEEFTLCVKDNEVEVCDKTENPLELTHSQAMALFLGLYCEKRAELAANVSQWLPLDFAVLSADKV